MDSNAQSPLPPVGAKRTASGSPAPAPASGLAALPPFIAHSILLSSVQSYDQNNLSLSNLHRSKPFQDLAKVSKQWRTLALDTATSVALAKFTVSIANAKRKDLLELRRQLTLQRAFLRTLDIRQIPRVGQLNADQWAALLRCVPQLKEIKLNSLEGATPPQLGVIVRAVGQQCKSLESLVVSAAYRHNQNERTPAESVRRQLSEPVFDTMEQVYKHTNRIGLRRLRVSMRHDLQGLASTRKYMDHVLRYCPNLERFDGYQAGVYAIDTRLCYEQWVMDLDLWTRFCATLRHLNEFDWICVPFATRYFEIFGQHVKPNVKKMTFTTATNWKWDRFMQDVGPKLQEQLTESGFAGTATNVHAALEACPNVTELSIRWPKATTELNPEVFGDDFWEAAAERCPYISKITMCPVDENTTTTISTFTDRSLRALAKLSWLDYFEVDNVNVTGDGIFDVTVHHAASNSGSARSFHVNLGDPRQDETDTSFYDAVTRFLERLLDAEAPLPCSTRKVQMYVKNLRTREVNLAWSTSYIARFQQLIPQVKAKHPNVLLKAFAHECDGTSFARMSEFIFDTDARMTAAWIQDGDTRVSDSLWNREDDFGAEGSEDEYAYDYYDPYDPYAEDLDAFADDAYDDYDDDDYDAY